MDASELNPEGAPFWQGTATGRLRYQRCGQCDQVVFSPRMFCPNCSSADLSWHDSAGRGRLYSYSIVHRDGGPDLPAPYVLALVDLDEGYRMMTNIVGAADEDLRIDAEVMVDFARRPGTDHTLPVFRLAEQGEA